MDDIYLSYTLLYWLCSVIKSTKSFINSEKWGGGGEMPLPLNICFDISYIGAPLNIRPPPPCSDILATPLFQMTIFCGLHTFFYKNHINNFEPQNLLLWFLKFYCCKTIDLLFFDKNLSLVILIKRILIKKNVCNWGKMCHICQKKYFTL